MLLSFVDVVVIFVVDAVVVIVVVVVVVVLCGNVVVDDVVITELFFESNLRTRIFDYDGRTSRRRSAARILIRN